MDGYSKVCYYLANMKKTILVLCFALILVCNSFAEKLLFRLNDPTGDDHGPGSYVYPKNPVFKEGAFDLTGFEVYEGDENITFKVYFKNNFISPPDLLITVDKNIKDLFKTNLYLQNIDIYIDKDHKLNSGIVNAIPGRNVKIAPESAWEQAIFISPQPFLARVETKRLAKKIADNIIIPADYEVAKNYVQFKIPKKVIGQPTERWGYLVFTTGAEWETSMFSLSNWMNYGSLYEEPDLNRIVDQYAGEWEFGGGDDSGTAPNVIDMLVASGESQEKMLGGYNPNTKKRASIYAVYPFSSTLEASDVSTTEGKGREAKVLDVLKNVITIDKGDEAGLLVGKIGQVFDGNDTLIASVMVEETREQAAICTIIPMSQSAEITPGMKVMFK